MISKVILLLIFKVMIFEIQLGFDSNDFLSVISIFFPNIFYIFFNLKKNYENRVNDFHHDFKLFLAIWFFHFQQLH